MVRFCTVRGVMVRVRRDGVREVRIGRESGAMRGTVRLVEVKAAVRSAARSIVVVVLDATVIVWSMVLVVDDGV